MKGEGHTHPHLPPATQPFFFQRRSERLDWRQIASLDLEKVMQEGSISSLEEYLLPILFCRAEAEFHPDSTDPGFIKVFKVCQLIGEYLLSCWERDRDKGSALEKVVEELKDTKDSLAALKKELKRTKDMLASTQSQVLGDNRDEIDQCPYCSKRFLTPFYLLAHIQRRHQGLPLPPELCRQPPIIPLLHKSSTNTTAFPANTPTVYAFTISPNGIENSTPPTQPSSLPNPSPSSEILTLEKRRDSQTQTNPGEIHMNTKSEGELHENGSNLELQVIKSPEPPSGGGGGGSSGGGQGLDLPMICDLVEKYLEQSSSQKKNLHYHKILDSIESASAHNPTPRVLPVVSDTNVTPSPIMAMAPTPSPSAKDVERIEENVTRMKDEFEKKWTLLSNKVRDSGVEHLTAAFLTEIKKVQDMILHVPTTTPQLPTPSPLHHHEVTVQHQPPVGKSMELTSQFAKLSDSLQSTMRQEVAEVKAKLLSQEGVWRERIANLEQQHLIHIQRLEEQLVMATKKSLQLKSHQHKIDRAGEENLSKNPDSEHLDFHHSPEEQQHKHSDNDESLVVSPQEPHQFIRNQKSRAFMGPIAKPRRVLVTHVNQSLGPNSTGSNCSISSPQPHPHHHPTTQEIPSDCEYLTVIDAETPSDRSPPITTPQRSRPPPPKPKPQNEYEEPLLVPHGDMYQMSHYTYSSSSEAGAVSLALSGEDDADADKGGLNGVEKASGRKYVRDWNQGKVVDGCESRSQLDMVRDRMLRSDLDKQMETLGINPEASTLGLQEMARAIKYMKADSRASPHHLNLAGDLHTLRKEVNYEVAVQSLQNKMGRYSPKRKSASGASGASAFSNIFKKVKKSGSSWKQKVTSAMRKKPKSSTTTDSTLKTTFFSKWGRKKQKPNNAKVPSSLEGSSSCSQSGEESESQSSQEIHHPYMSRSQPILRPHKRKHRPRSPPSHSDSEDDDDVHLPKPKPRPRRATNKSPKASPKKCPNFFVSGSPQGDKTREATIPVTSNGWGGGESLARDYNPPPPQGKQYLKENEPFARSGDTRRPFRRRSHSLSDQEEEAGEQQHAKRNASTPPFPRVIRTPSASPKIKVIPPRSPASDGDTSVWDWETEEEQEIDEDGQVVKVKHNPHNSTRDKEYSTDSTPSQIAIFPTNYQHLHKKPPSPPPQGQRSKSIKQKDNSWDSDDE